MPGEGIVAAAEFEGLCRDQGVRVPAHATPLSFAPACSADGIVRGEWHERGTNECEHYLNTD